MSIDFIAQPQATFRIGDFLKESFADTQWTEFRAAVAFVKRSGTKHITQSLNEFGNRGGKVKISVGIDAGGTSAEGLTDLLNSVQTPNEIFVFNNASSSTFHPKIYLFNNATAASIVIGSGNLTEGGLFTNYEASLLLRLDLENENDAALYVSIIQTLDEWSTPTAELCCALDQQLLIKLEEEGYIPDESKAWSDGTIAAKDGSTKEPSLFAGHRVQRAPIIDREPATSPSEINRIAEPKQANSDSSQTERESVDNRFFVMTLQKTDVGVGQTTEGAQRRSPEIFIPLAARNLVPSFWGWPNEFIADPSWNGVIDREGYGKMDRPNVICRLGGADVSVSIWYNPRKKDMRIRNEEMRSSGSVDDILYIECSQETDVFDYYVDIVPQGSSRHADLLLQCTNTVRNSKRLFGYG